MLHSKTVRYWMGILHGVYRDPEWGCKVLNGAFKTWIYNTNLPKLFVMVDRLLNESTNAYFWIFMNKIFPYWCTNTLTNEYIMLKCLKHPKPSPRRLLGSLLSITYRHLPNCQIGKSFRKISNVWEINPKPISMERLYKRLFRLNIKCCYEMSNCNTCSHATHTHFSSEQPSISMYVSSVTGFRWMRSLFCVKSI